jgi:hypothetical protein
MGKLLVRVSEDQVAATLLTLLRDTVVCKRWRDAAGGGLAVGGQQA